jgi:hypothetical protein
MNEAQRIADRLREGPATECCSLEGDFGDLQFFALPVDGPKQQYPG